MITISDIHHSYGDLQVLKGIDLTIDRGEIVSIVGPSGAGKSTLLQIMGSLQRPCQGSVVIDGEDIYRLKDSALARFRNKNIGFVFQFHQLLPEFTLEENIALPALIGGTSRKQSLARARELMEYLGIASRATHRPAQLSGGEQQRAAVARALVNKPMVVMADEPSGSLDSHNRTELHRLFSELRRDMGQTFVIVTHDAELASIADRRVTMSDGIITEITQPRSDG